MVFSNASPWSNEQDPFPIVKFPEQDILTANCRDLAQGISLESTWAGCVRPRALNATLTKPFDILGIFRGLTKLRLSFHIDIGSSDVEVEVAPILWTINNLESLSLVLVIQTNGSISPPLSPNSTFQSILS